MALKPTHKPDPSDFRRVIQHDFTIALAEFANENNLKQGQIAEAVGVKTWSVAQWFSNGEHYRLPSLEVAVKLSRLPWLSFLTSKRHGRKFNFVRLHTGREYTRYEQKLEGIQARVFEWMEEKVKAGESVPAEEIHAFLSRVKGRAESRVFEGA